MHPHPRAESVFVFCRPGLESDCAAELVERAGMAGVGAWCRTGEGWIDLVPTADGDLERLAVAVRFAGLVFTRQWLAQLADLADLDTADRVRPIVERVVADVTAFGELRVEHPDGPSGRPLAKLARSLVRPLERALSAAGITREGGAPVLHLVLTDGDRARVGLSDPHNSAPWPGGIPRLRVPKAAPSRSVLKLEEAIGMFLSPAERAQWLAPGRTAVDLGAAPGGWTWLLAERGLRVDAVDNARLDPALLERPRVRHHRADGFTFRPKGRVDWLVCDMVERPHRIARLAGDWLERGDCVHALFNLKLPMKRRWASVREHLDTLAGRLPVQGRLAAKQLYHDREEVTVFATTRQPIESSHQR